jgi:hypothetical protein
LIFGPLRLTISAHTAGRPGRLAEGIFYEPDYRRH